MFLRTIFAALLGTLVFLSACGQSSTSSTTEAVDDAQEEATAAPATAVPATDAPPNTEPDPTAGEPAADQAEDDQTSSDLEATLRDIHARMGSVIRPEAVPWSDLSKLAELGEDAQNLLAEAHAAVGETSGTSAMREALVNWDADISGALVAIEAGSTDLQAEVTSWLDGPREGPPPIAVTEITDAIIVFGAEAYQEACVGYATEAQLALDCAAVTQDPNTSGPTEAGAIEVGMGVLELGLDVGVVSSVFVDRDIVGLELTPSTTFTLFVPPRVADPAGELEAEAIASPVPWPADVVAWAESLPLTSSNEAIEIAGVTYTGIALDGAGPEIAIVENEAVNGGVHTVGGGRTMFLWVGEIEGQTLVAMLEAFSDAELSAVRSDAEAILASLRVLG